MWSLISWSLLCKWGRDSLQTSGTRNPCKWASCLSLQKCTSNVSPLHTKPSRKYFPIYEEDKLLAQDHIVSILKKIGKLRQAGDLHIHYAGHHGNSMLLRYAWGNEHMLHSGSVVILFLPFFFFLPIYKCVLISQFLSSYINLRSSLSTISFNNENNIFF